MEIYECFFELLFLLGMIRELIDQIYRFLRKKSDFDKYKHKLKIIGILNNISLELTNILESDELSMQTFL